MRIADGGDDGQEGRPSRTRRQSIRVLAATQQPGQAGIHVWAGKKYAIRVVPPPVEPGETITTALTRELREEGNIELSEQPDFFAIYFNHRASRRDHVALYVVRSFHQSAPPQPNHEIIAHGFFAPDALPEDTTRATRARIAEVVRGRAIAELW